MSSHDAAQLLAARFEQLCAGPLIAVRAPALVALAQRVVVITDGQLEHDTNVIMALLSAAAESMTHVEELSVQRNALQLSIKGAQNEAEVHNRLRAQLKSMEPGRAALARDFAAVHRWLDAEALDDRLAKHLADQVDQVELCYLVGSKLLTAKVGSIWELSVAKIVDLALAHARRSRLETIGVNALLLLTVLVERAPENERLALIGPSHLRALRGLLEESERSVWFTIATLRLLCRALPTPDARAMLQRELLSRKRQDGMFVRHAALQLCNELTLEPSATLDLLKIAADDPSQHVRQGLAQALLRLPRGRGAKLLSKMCLDAASEKVSAYALCRLFELTDSQPEVAPRLHSTAVRCLELCPTIRGFGALTLRVLCQRLRTACHAAPGWLDHQRFVAPLSSLLENPKLPLDLAAEIAALLAALEVYHDPNLNELRRRLRETLGEIRVGQSSPLELPKGTTSEQLDKALCVATYADHVVALRKLGPQRYLLTRGEQRRFKLWRFLHEVQNPAPDKRQAYHHSSGRTWQGEIVTAPRGMAEVAKTSVPGERRVHAAVGGWGDFLPLVDDVLFACGIWRREHRVVSSFASVSIRGPLGIWARLWCWLRLTLAYARYAQARERSLEAKDDPTRRKFVESLKQLGVQFSIDNHTGRVADVPLSRLSPTLRRYYSGAGLVVLPTWAEGLVGEMFSPTSNSVWHLGIVVWLALSGMIVRAAWIRRSIDRHRKQLPLCIGGWGSRGKSGTERLKAALFHALRFDVVVKTTGCEAMFIHARRDMPARELFVYRAYDRATIWEQAKILDYACRLNADVFLWECMALRPEFVRVLQEEWMRDDMTTLTNAYPDHEDVMGPSGEDVAQVIGSFTGANAVMFTSEAQMLPVLRAAAEKKGSRVVAVSELDAELLPDDLLQRFPYAEHPNNIALVLALAEHLGVPRDWALAKVADHVVPDLGVLKTYPTVDYETRQLSFSNGMSANERAGFLSNWKRLGFDALGPQENPESIMVAVVNNRADRVPRSRVFAELLTWDAVVDRLVLIGTNLTTLERLLEDAVSRYLADQPLTDAAQLSAIFEHFRVPSSWQLVRRRLELVLMAAGHAAATVAKTLPGGELTDIKQLRERLRQLDAPQAATSVGVASSESVAKHVEFLLSEYEQACELRKLVLAALASGPMQAAERQLHEQLKQLFMRRVTVVHDSHATGDQVVHQVAMVTPPGHHARILGCQNIKGTGLDFVYRWVSLAQVVQSLERLFNERGARAEMLAWLSGYGDYGLIDAELTLRKLEPLLVPGDPDWLEQREALSVLVKSLRELVQTKKNRLIGHSKVGPLARLVNAFEPWIDHLDSIYRARRANAIVQDLFSNRVGQARAARLLREVVARGKGGWLYDGLRSFFHSDK